MADETDDLRAEINELRGRCARQAETIAARQADWQHMCDELVETKARYAEERVRFDAVNTQLRDLLDEQEKAAKITAMMTALRNLTYPQPLPPRQPGMTWREVKSALHPRVRAKLERHEFKPLVVRGFPVDRGDGKVCCVVESPRELVEVICELCPLTESVEVTPLRYVEERNDAAGKNSR